MKIEKRTDFGGKLTGYVVYPFCDEDATWQETASAFSFALNLYPGEYFGTITGINRLPVSLELARQFRDGLMQIILLAEASIPDSKERVAVTPSERLTVFKGGGE
jgi:hypothetical protein